MWRRLIPLLSIVALLPLLAACATEQAATPAAVPTVEEPPTGGVPAECVDNADMRRCAVIEPGETIKIGFAGPMTGDNSAFGQDISQAGQIAVADLGEMDGFTFELVVEDDQGTGEGGAQVANRFVSDPTVVAIAGHTFSGATAAAKPIYMAARIPMLSGSATQADLTTDAQDVFNRIAFTDDVQGTKAAEYLFEKLGVQKLAVMHDGSAYGQGLAEKVRTVFTELGGEVVAFEPITPGEADYSGPLNAVGANAPDALYYGGYNAEAAVIKNQMSVAGLGDAVFFSDDGTYGKNFLDLTKQGGSGEGAYSASAVPPASEAREAFEAKYLDRFGVEAGVLSTFTWHGYDIVAALISAVKSVAVVGGDGNLYVPRESLVKAARSLSGYPGLTGDITCNEVGECNTAGPTFFVVKDGAWVEASE
jgi:branched-chain amino acid transport system substrate-binding protein